MLEFICEMEYSMADIGAYCEILFVLLHLMFFIFSALSGARPEIHRFALQLIDCIL